MPWVSCPGFLVRGTVCAGCETTMMKHILILWLSLLLFGAGCGSGDSPASPEKQDEPDNPAQTAVVFADSSLEAAVRQALDKADGDLSEADLLTLTQLDAEDRGITDLSGIEYLKNLQALNLAGNQLQDISRLAALAHLEMLDLGSNHIADISALGHLGSLEFLVLEDNAVSDIADLLDFVLLDGVELSGNPLDELSRSTHLDALEARGVAVTFRQPAPPQEMAPDTVAIADPVLLRSVRVELMRATRGDLTIPDYQELDADTSALLPDELLVITSLYAGHSDAKIESLVGIEAL